MIETFGPVEYGRQRVKSAPLTEAEIRQGVTESCWRWGSHGYYLADEITRCLADRDGVVAYLAFDVPPFDEAGKLFVFYRRPEDRKEVQRGR